MMTRILWDRKYFNRIILIHEHDTGYLRHKYRTEIFTCLVMLYPMLGTLYKDLMWHVFLICYNFVTILCFACSTMHVVWFIEIFTGYTCGVWYKMRWEGGSLWVVRCVLNRSIKYWMTNQYILYLLCVDAWFLVSE